MGTEVGVVFNKRSDRLWLPRLTEWMRASGPALNKLGTKPPVNPFGCSTASFDEQLRELQQSVYERRASFSVEGILLVVLGSLAIVIPSLVTVAVTIFLGWLLLISGIVGLVTTFWARHVPGFWWSLLSATLVIAAGIVLLGWPVRGAISLTLLLIVFFIIEGVLSIMCALEHKREPSGRWGWVLLSGIIGFILAAVIWAGLPAKEWVLGLLVGMKMLCGGSAMIAMAMSGSSLDH
jgi:uncharacterized membrane protein HdeD (DUF308 family)